MKGRIESIFDEIAKDIAYKVKDITSIKNILENYDVQGKSVLDVGCGIGDYLIYYAQRGARYAEGFDISTENIKLAEYKAAHLPNIFFRKCDLEDYMTEQRFDLILALGIFEYLKDPLQSLKKISSFLADEGILIIYISEPILIKKISFLFRMVLSRVPLKFIMPIAEFLDKLLQLFGTRLKKILHVGKSSTYTLKQTILEGLAVSRFNIFHHRLFFRYLHEQGFSMHIFHDGTPSMICLVAKKGGSFST